VTKVPAAAVEKMSDKRTTYSDASLTGREHAVEGFFDKVILKFLARS
jgi:hypothetical protein